MWFLGNRKEFVFLHVFCLRHSRRVVCIRFPIGFIIRRRLISPHIPSRTIAARKELDIGTTRTGFDQRDKLIQLTRMFAFFGADEIDLCTGGLQGAIILAANAKEQDLCDIAKVKPYAAPVGIPVLTDFLSDDIGLIGESPRLHHGKTVWQQGVRHP